MNWKEIKEEKEIDALKEISHNQPVLIFKHSTRCSISAAALGRLERNWKEAEVGTLLPYYLDLISYRSISALIQDTFRVEHESPQVLIIRDGKCIYNASHTEIVYKDLIESIKQ